ncbi:MAG: DUF1015 domain-containing protein [Candidatus Eisenbacteria bacterium]
MPNVLPFCAVRPAVAGDLAARLSPPYDVIAPAERARLARDPHNPVHVILPEDDPAGGKAAEGSRYEAARRSLDGWLAEGALARDRVPAFYPYEQRFTHAARELTRRGFFGLLELREFGEGGVYAHERTLNAPKEDRYRLLSATRTNLSPGFVLYEDPKGEVKAAVDAARAQKPLAAARTAEGQETLWAVANAGDDSPEARCMAAGVEAIARTLRGQGLVFADGHHRYEAALRYRRERRAAEPDAPFPQAYDFMLACFVEASDPGLLVLPTHRVVRGLEHFTMAELAEKLDGPYRIEGLGDCADAEAAAWRAEAFLTNHPVGAFVAVSAHERVLTGFVLDSGARAQTFAGLDVPPALQVLDVVQLHELVLGKALGITAEKLAAQSHVEYVKSMTGAVRIVRGEETAAGAVAGAAGALAPSAAFLMNATPVAQVLAVARAGERMPQKSTYFLPKITTGWVYHVHDAPDAVWGAQAASHGWWPAAVPSS